MHVGAAPVSLLVDLVFLFARISGSSMETLEPACEWLTAVVVGIDVVPA